MASYSSTPSNYASASQKQMPPLLIRMRLILALIFFILTLFGIRLIYLQFVQSEVLKVKSRENHISQYELVPLRGRILARDGTVLADNRVAVDLMYLGGEVVFFERISHLLELKEPLSPPNLEDPKEKQYGKVIAWDIPHELLPTLEELVAEQTKVTSGPFAEERSLYLRKRIERTYPTTLAAHVVGYTKEEDPERFVFAGMSGIETSYQQDLFGQLGHDVVERNNKGRIVQIFEESHQDAIPGQDITLTIDPELQALAEKSLSEATPYQPTAAA